MIKYTCFTFLLICLVSYKNKQSESRVDHLPFYNEATFKANWIKENDKTLDTFHQISTLKNPKNTNLIVWFKF